MDYEKEYKEALSIARIAHKDEDRHLKATLERIFPELKESEYERIRKGIIGVVKGTMPDNDYRKKYLDWLEKQSQENMVEALRLEYEKGKSDALSEQRKEWTAEDLLNRNEIYDILDEYCRDDLFDWLHEQLCAKPCEDVWSENEL